MSVLASGIASGCRAPVSSRHGDDDDDGGGTAGVARVDLERVRRDAKLAGDAVDGELTARLVADAIARAQGRVLVDDRADATDITDAVLAALALEPTASMAWLVGPWQSTAEGTTTTEQWCPGTDGTLHGYNTTERDGERVAFEWLTISASPAGPVYLAQPQGTTPGTAFADAKDTTPLAARFENPDNEFPERLQYTREAAALHVLATGGEHKLEWTWQRTGDDAAVIANACASITARTHPAR